MHTKGHKFISLVVLSRATLVKISPIIYFFLFFNCNLVVFARSSKTIIKKVTYQQVLSAWTCWQTQWGLLSLCRKYFSIYKAAKLSGIAINGKSDDLIGWIGPIRSRGRFSRNSLSAEYWRCTLRVMHKHLLLHKPTTVKFIHRMHKWRFN